MKRRLIIIPLVLLLCSLAGLAREDEEENEPAVSIKRMRFNPNSLTVKVGETVTWTNIDDRDHTVVANDKSFKSGNLSKDDEFEHTFKKPGKYKYSCTYHPRMKGEIIVEK